MVSAELKELFFEALDREYGNADSSGAQCGSQPCHGIWVGSSSRLTWSRQTGTSGHPGRARYDAARCRCRPP